MITFISVIAEVLYLSLIVLEKALIIIAILFYAAALISGQTLFLMRIGGFLERMSERVERELFLCVL